MNSYLKIITCLVLMTLGQVSLAHTTDTRYRDQYQKKMVKVSVGGGKNTVDSYKNNAAFKRDVLERIQWLEKAVAQLQRIIDNAQIDQGKARKNYACVVTTSFNGQFIGKGRTETEAKAKAVNKCKAKDAFPCSRVSCEKYYGK